MLPHGSTSGFKRDRLMETEIAQRAVAICAQAVQAHGNERDAFVARR
jgi:hypothetical protein